MSMMMIAGRCMLVVIFRPVSAQTTIQGTNHPVPSEDDENGLEMVIKVEGPVL